MQKHFSAHAASALLERGERTIRRALRNVRPDSFERGQARYRLAKIVSAVEAKAGRPNTDDAGVNIEALALIDELELLFKQLDDGVARLMREPNLERRREISLREKIGSVIPHLDEKMREICAVTNEEDRAVSRILLNDYLLGASSNSSKQSIWCRATKTLPIGRPRPPRHMCKSKHHAGQRPTDFDVTATRQRSNRRPCSGGGQARHQLA